MGAVGGSAYAIGKESALGRLPADTLWYRKLLVPPTMTIRQYIDRCARPYRRNMWISGIAFGIGGLCMVLTARHVPSLGERTPAWPFWSWVAFIAPLYLGGFVGVAASCLISNLRIRCPSCGKRLGIPSKRWNYCHFCGVPFDSETQDPSGERQGQTPGGAEK